MFIRYILLFLLSLLVISCGYKLPNKKVSTSKNLEYPKKQDYSSNK